MKVIRLFALFLIIQLVWLQKSNGQERYVDSLINWLKEHPKIDSEYIITLHRISYRTNETDIKKSFEYYEKVTTLSNELNFTYGKALAQINLAILLSNSANFEASNDAYFKAIAYAEQANALRLESISLNNIGDNFKSLKDYEKCREYTLKAIAINKKLEAWRGVAFNFELLQRCDFIEGHYEDAKQKLDSGMNYALLSKDSYIISLYYLGYGKNESQKGNLDKAKEFFNLAMYQASLEDDRRNKYQVYLARVRYLTNLSSAQKRNYLDSAYDIASSTEYQEGIGESAQMLSDYYDRQRNKDSSFKYFHIYRKSFDTIFSENNRRNVIIKESDWLIKQQEIENKHLQQIAAIQKKELGFKNILLAAVIALLILSGIIAFFVYKSIQASKKKEISEFEKKMLRVRMASLQSQMNPHFIFNCLNSIENFVMQNDKLAASQYLNKFSSLVRTILDSSSMDSIPFAKDLEASTIYIELEKLRFNNKFEFKSEIESTLLDPEFQVPPLLIQPYIENAIIHGLAPSEKENLYLKISAFIEDGYINYIVEDNGIGRELSKKYRQGNPHKHKSIGMKLTQEKMNIYSKQNNIITDIQIIDMYDKGEASGTRCILKIKVN